MRRAIVIALALSGCVDEGDEVETSVDTAELSSWKLKTFTTNGFGMANWDDVAPTDDTACFLAGLDGNLQAASGDEALVGVYPVGDSYSVTMYNNANHPIRITVACVSPAPNKTDQIFVNAGGIASVQQTGNANTHCFLTSVGSAHGGFDNFDDAVKIEHSGSHFTFSAHRTNANQFMDARMVCFDTPTSYGAYFGSWTAMGTVGGPLASNAAGGVACGLTSVGGKYHFNDTSSGVRITYDSAAKQWNWTLSDIKQGSVECVK